MKKIIIALFLLIVQPAYCLELKDILSEAMHYYNEGNCHEALPLFEKIFEANLDAVKNNKNLEYSLYYYAGYCSKMNYEMDKAGLYFQKALHSAKQLDIKEQIPVINVFLGNVYKEINNYKLAEKHYGAALAKLDNVSMQKGTILFLLAETYLLSGAYEAALTTCQEAVVIARKNNNIPLEVSCLLNDGNIYYRKADYPKAISIYVTALNMSRTTQMPNEMAASHLDLAKVYQKVRKYDLALTNYDESMRMYIALGNTSKIPYITDRLRALPVTGPIIGSKVKKSINKYIQYSESVAEEGDTKAFLNLSTLICAYKFKTGESIEAREICSNVLELSMQEEFFKEAAIASYYISQIDYKDNKTQEAYKLLEEQLTYQSSVKKRPFVSIIYAATAVLNEMDNNLVMARYNYKKAAVTSIDKEETEIYIQKYQELNK